MIDLLSRSSTPTIQIAESKETVMAVAEEMEILPVVTRSLNQQQRPMFDIIEPSIVRTQFSLAKPTLRDASFSSYLQPNDSILPTTKHRADDSEISIFGAEKYFNGLHDQKGKEGSTPKQSDVSSIPRISSVSSFDDSSNIRNYRARSFHATPTASSEASWNSQSGLLSHPPGSSAFSIENLPGSSNNKNRKSLLKWLPLRCRCPCLGKKSVQVEETKFESKSPKTFNLRRSNSGGSSIYSNRQSIATSPRPSTAYAAAKGITSSPNDQNDRNDFSVHPKSDQSKLINPNPSLNGFLPNRNHQIVTSRRSFSDNNGATTNGFTFPILNNATPSMKRMFNIITPATGAAVDDPPRDSLEVFQPREALQSGGGRERQSFHIPASPRSRKASYDEEIGSDASSDLFEIESFSTQATSYNPAQMDSLDENSSFHVKRFGITTAVADGGGVNCRRSIDEQTTPSIAATECYPPSEVSVNWSVTTAEGFDHASLSNFSATASEVEYTRGEAQKNEKLGGGGGGDDVGGSRRRGNGLLSCRCEKAVSVGPGPIKCGADAGRSGASGLDGPVRSTVGHVSGRAQPTSVAKPPLGRVVRSSLLSATFAT